MNKTETVRARISPVLKRAAEGVLDELGITASEAITLFYTQLAVQRRLPLDLNAGADIRHGPAMTAADLLASGAVGAWAGRSDIGDSAAYARALRDAAERERRPHP